MKSFTLGRKIVAKENTDRKINTEIENSVMGICMRKPKGEPKTKKKTAVAIHFTPKDEIFGSIDLKKRTDEYYKKFAEDTLENDIQKELRHVKSINTLGGRRENKGRNLK